MTSTRSTMLAPFYRSAVRQFDTRVRAVRPEQWTVSTPDVDWDVQRLVRHVISGQARVAGLLTGDPAGAPAAAGPDPVDDWGTAAAAAVAAVEGLEAPDRVITLPDGPTTADALGWRLVTELTVHAWDLARAIDAPDEFPNDLLARVLDQAKQHAGQWFAASRYGAPIPVPGCTDDLTELLALTGRNRWWRRS